MDRRSSISDPMLYETLKGIPKVELHRHLEGSLRLTTLAEIARQCRMDLPGYEVEDIRSLVQMTVEDEANPGAYLSKFGALRGFFQSPEIIDRLVYEAVADAAADGIVYFELRFTPMALARAKSFPLADVTDWAIAAAERGSRDFGIEVRLIVSMNRHESVELGHEVARIAIERMDRGIVGLDLAGAENKYLGEEFAPIFSMAREAGLGVTIHAGEWAGPESIVLAVERLGALRLGHGVRVIEDAGVLQMTRERGIVYEVCPTSNVQSGVSRSYEQHPLRIMYRTGLLTTLNTDNSSVSGVTLSQEMLRAIEYQGFTLGDLKQQILTAARAAFLPPADRNRLVSHLSAALDIDPTKSTAHPYL